ncbi:hypothetical protein ACFL6S_18435 [Candidatus Poribacteria bacterium]
MDKNALTVILIACSIIFIAFFMWMFDVPFSLEFAIFGIGISCFILVFYIIDKVTGKKVSRENMSGHVLKSCEAWLKEWIEGELDIEDSVAETIWYDDDPEPFTFITFLISKGRMDSQKVTLVYSHKKAQVIGWNTKPDSSMLENPSAGFEVYKQKDKYKWFDKMRGKEARTNVYVQPSSKATFDSDEEKK